MRLITEHSHLTQGNKVAIRAILGAGLSSGRVGRTDYYITKNEDGTIKVVTRYKMRHCIGAELTTTQSTFLIKL